MQRITTTLDDDLVDELDRLVMTEGYQGRSEALRDLLRAGLHARQQAGEPASGPGIAALVYVYDHHRRDLARRLTANSHDHHDLTLATLHVHLDRSHCLEINLLKGERSMIRHFAAHVTAERGVCHGRLIEIPDLPAGNHDRSDETEEQAKPGQ